MGRMLFLLASLVATAGVVARPASGTKQADEDADPVFGIRISPGYRDWKLITVAREDGDLNDLRAVLGNEIAIKAYREGQHPFPDGSIIARIAWRQTASEENNKTFGKPQSFVAGPPVNGVQFMVKDSRKYASTGGWGYAHFDENTHKPAAKAVQESCFPCHLAIKSRDYVFARYSP